MTRREAIRRLERMALENGYKRKHYIKRALVEFLENREPLLSRERDSRPNGLDHSLGDISPRMSKYPN